MNNEIQNKLVDNDIAASFPYLIEIWKSSDTEKETVYRYVNASEDKVFENNTYTASYFKITPPEKTNEGIKDAKITISTVDQTWVERVRNSQERFKIRFVAVIDYEEDGDEYIEPLDDITFYLTKASWNETSLSCTMRFDDRLDIKVPCQKFSQFVCPALF